MFVFVCVVVGNILVCVFVIDVVCGCIVCVCLSESGGERERGGDRGESEREVCVYVERGERHILCVHMLNYAATYTYHDIFS